jgi:RES domain-containing protein
LAVLEYRVNTRRDPDDLIVHTIDIPDTVKIERVDWMPASLTAQRFGDVWIRDQRTPVLAVPSVVVPKQINYLLNPSHADLRSAIQVIDTQRIALDLRLFDLTLRPSIP